jgi:hypothetical protein
VNETPWPAAIVRGRDGPFRRNSGLLIVAEEMVTLDPVAVRVVVRLLLAPTLTLPKFKVLALGVNCPVEAPVPDTVMLRFGLEAFETTVIAPLTRPAAVGAKMTPKVNLCPLVRLKGRASPLNLNPAPVTVP